MVDKALAAWERSKFGPKMAAKAACPNFETMPRTPLYLVAFFSLALLSGAQAQQPSSFDKPAPNDNLSALKRDLYTLDSAGVFRMAQVRALRTLPPAHRSWFVAHPSLRLLEAARGPLFGNGADAAFLVYDVPKQRLGYLLYSAAEGRYGWLYRDYPVFNALASANCSSYSPGSVDRRIADELADLKKELLKQPAGLAEYDFLQVTPFHKNENLLPRQGCFSLFPDGRNFIGKTVLSLATGLVYNDWECLAWDGKKKRFVLFFGQAFAD